MNNMTGGIRYLSKCVDIVKSSTKNNFVKEKIKFSLVDLFPKKYKKPELGRWDLINGRKFWNLQEGKNYPY